MDERILRFRVGVVMITAGSIAVILIVIFGAIPNPFQKRYTIHVAFPAAPGVTVDTPVRKSGVPIGRVTAVQLRDEGGVTLTLQINAEHKLWTSEVARISTGSLVTGDAIIEFIPGPDKHAPRELIRDGEYLANGRLTEDPFQVLVRLEGKMTSAMQTIEEAGSEVTMAARNFHAILGNNEDQIQRIVQKTEYALDHFQQAMDSINNLVGDPQLNQQLKQTLNDLPQLFADARQTLASTQQTLEGFEGMSRRAERNLKNLEGITGPLGERGPKIVANIDRSIASVDELLSQLVRFSEALNNREGTLGQLVYDPELYHRLNKAAGNVEEVTRRLRPIVDDMRVFSDKLARDPRQLGVKGALDRRPSGTGFKGSVGSQWLFNR